MKINRLLFLLPLTLIVIGCSHAPPRLTRDVDVDTSLRSEYLRTNPESPYNDYIQKGEVIKGMGLMEVLASWGVPNVRLAEAAKGQEHWVYYVRDDHSMRIVGYRLTFVDRNLDGWRVDKNVTDLGMLTPKDLIPIPTHGETAVEERPPAGGTDAPIKKRP